MVWVSGVLHADETPVQMLKALPGHLFDHLQSPGKGKSGMLMSVHPVGYPEWVGCLATSSLSNPTRINTGYNLLNLHN